MSLYEHFTKVGPSGFGYGSTAEQVTEGLSLAGKTFLVTGCNSGLGLETMRVLALRGARVVGTARTEAKAREADARVTGGEVVPVACELADAPSIHRCIEAVKAHGFALDAIVCNAGIMALPKLEKAYGYELQFITNHVGHFMLVNGLLDQLTDTGRVVMLSSDAHKRAPRGGIDFDNLDGSRGYSSFGAYGRSKIANILFALELSNRLRGTKRTANSLHPGVIDTNLARNMNPLVGAFYAVAGPLALKSIPQGAATQVFVATHPSLEGVSGKYFSNCNVARPRRDGTDEATAKKLWTVTEEIVAKLPRE
ncbi:MAG: SDR family oxidoreductase [Labilithrix sp.]|nr:SDR family oxidoreductase [Labilithrix sp.]MCW5810970.1 SDR family oxidoreductase [Labilithrix sp.]